LIEKNRCYTLFATHYFELTQLSQRHPQAVNQHLAAAEHRDGIVFLHEVRDGPASRSYGLQVARLAGLPPAVLRQARTLLEQLESRYGPDTQQADLFADDALQAVVEASDEGIEHPAVQSSGDHAPTDAGSTSAFDEPARLLAKRVRLIEPDTLTPRQALDLLYELHQLAARKPH
jgi:DNA mismatch repair protein MutS